MHWDHLIRNISEFLVRMSVHVAGFLKLDAITSTVHRGGTGNKTIPKKIMWSKFIKFFQRAQVCCKNASCTTTDANFISILKQLSRMFNTELRELGNRSGWSGFIVMPGRPSEGRDSLLIAVIQLIKCFSVFRCPRKINTHYRKLTRWPYSWIQHN